MKKLLLLLVLSLVFTTGGYSQSIWTPVQEARLSGLEKTDRAVTPVKAKYFSLNVQELRSQLEQAPSRDLGGSSNVIISFPDGNGKLDNYRIFETSVLHPDLAAQFPGIKSYVGVGIEKPAATISFTLTLFGLHTMTLSPEGTSYAEPFTKDFANYIVYKKSDIRSPRNFSCGVVEDEDEAAHRFGPQIQNTQANDSKLRRYRLAMASSIEYSQYHVQAAGLSVNAPVIQQKEAVLAAMTVTVARVNSVYERDLAITLQLVPTNTNIIFLSGDDGLSNDGNMINQIQPIINSGIGVNNYDIGHVVGTGDGGVAALGSVCSSSKARGVTGNPNPVGDPFDIDYVAHEMGHQFGAEHTFNGTAGSCGGGNRNAATAVEPGSGTTIMAYAGICGNADVQINSDAYFHTVSMDQIFAFVNGAGGFCATQVPNNNTPPVITPLTNYTIPKGTPFVLRGNATDAGGNASLTYCWEQTNNSGTAANAPTTTLTSGPVFRSQPPSTSPNRYFPSLPNVLNGNLTSGWEVLPSVARVLNFALTVRDNYSPNIGQVAGGQTARANMNVSVNGTAGPFTVTSQNTAGLSYPQGSTQTITWNVAGTTANNVNTANVNILLSTDGGQTFSTVLLANTPNDGSQAVTMPNVQAANCRIMVEGAGNIFFAVNSNNFAIGVTVTEVCTVYTNNTVTPIPDGTGTNQPAPGGIASSIINVPAANTITSVKAKVNVTHPYVGDLLVALLHPDNTEIALWSGNCGSNDNFNVTFQNGAPALVCGNPTTGTYAPVGSLASLVGKQSNGNWTLLAADFFATDAGQINSWELEICSQSVAAINEFGLENFKLYPNPNNGSFTVEFNSSGNNNIAVSVHDISGRQIVNKSFDNTGMFSGNISLGSVQAGVYLVTVQDGGRKEVKKIVVE